MDARKIIVFRTIVLPAAHTFDFGVTAFGTKCCNQVSRYFSNRDVQHRFLQAQTIPLANSSLLALRNR